jgi:hypothetical protein
LQGGAAFVDSPPHQVVDTAEDGLCGRIGGEPALGELELHCGAEQSLQQGVVKFSCDAGSLEAAFFLTKIVFPGRLVLVGLSEKSSNSLGQWWNTFRFV